jgi:uncharacterized protein DUF6084
MSEGGPSPAAGAAADVEAPHPPDRPTPEFEVLGVDHVERAAAPTLRFRIAVRDRSELPVYTIALSALITIEPAKRAYAPSERARMAELFGEPERWSSTTASFRWAQADVLVPRFSGETTFELPVPCTYDHEVAASKYLDGLGDGAAPLRLHLNGTVFYEAGDGRLQMLTIPWDCSVRYAMPVEAWRRMIEAHYPFRRWIPLDPATVERLADLRAARGLPTFDACIDALLEREE